MRRYYWVVLKWLLASAATVALIVHQLAAVRVAAARAVSVAAGATQECDPGIPRAPIGVRIIFLALVLCLLAFIGAHLAGGGFHHHG